MLVGLHEKKVIVDEVFLYFNQILINKEELLELHQISNFNFKIQTMENTKFASCLVIWACNEVCKSWKCDPTVMVKIVSKATTCLVVQTNNFLTKNNNKYVLMGDEELRNTGLHTRWKW